MSEMKNQLMDERAAFEVAYSKILHSRGTPPTFAAFMKTTDGEYELPIVERAWAAWQARAALAANKADDARDAERYRLIRDLGASFNDYEDREYRVCEDAMDATLDRIRAAIAQQGKEG